MRDYDVDADLRDYMDSKNRLELWKEKRMPMPECYEVDGSRRMVVNDDGIVYCHCGKLGKRTDFEPTAGGSYFYVCSESGAPLGYSGI